LTLLDGSSSHTDRFDSQNAMDKKYNEVKGLNQKLMDVTFSCFNPLFLFPSVHKRARKEE